MDISVYSIITGKREQNLPITTLPLVKELHTLSGYGSYSLTSGAPNGSFLSDPLKRYFRRLSGVPLKLCRFI